MVKYPNVRDAVDKFLGRYGRKKLERGRDFFQHCLIWVRIINFQGVLPVIASMKSKMSLNLCSSTRGLLEMLVLDRR